MRLIEIEIENFKSFQRATFSPNSFGCLVGENNAGKSTILQAINFALKRPSQLPTELFYDADAPLVFRLRFSGITENHLARLAQEHRPRIAELVNEERLELTIRYEVGQKCETKVGRLVPIEARYRDDAISTLLAGKRPPAVGQAVAEAYPEFAEDCPDGVNITAAKAYLADCIRNLPKEQFAKEEAPLPSGISSSITALLPEPIYIPAVKNLADDLKTSQSTTFGRLLGLLLEDMSPDLVAINAALKDLEGMFNRVQDGDAIIDNRHQQVRALESTVEKYLKENFPTAKVELRVPPPELATILNSAQIFIDDGSRDLVENKGDGIKRSLTFALLQCYVERMHNTTEEGVAHRPLIFLFEEPELYLHPRSQRILFDTLARIATRFQVVVTTHSPIFFAPGITASFVRVEKRAANPKPVGHLHPVDFELDPESAEVFRMARFENADAAFFSRRVVLFEGESDDAFFKQLSKHLNPEWDFDLKNVAMVRVSGKGNFSKFRKFFEAFGIEVKIVADLDAFFEGFSHLGASGAAVETRAVALNKVDQRIAALGLKPEPSSRQIKDKVHSQTFKDRYEAAKAALRKVQVDGKISPKTIATFDALFTWEDDIARVRACCEDDQARLSLVETIDALRAEGICILINGAIEDYYPSGAPSSGAKPSRALAAAALVNGLAAAQSLSAPLGANREPELEEICAALFDGV